jgi:serine/threonine protein kinase
LENTKKFITDIDNSNHFLSNFIVRNLEAWQEDGLLYIKQEYCCEGDLLIFLERLEGQKFNFTTDFYWDLIFEMICVRKLKLKLKFINIF